jgi:hypothetical protein
MDAGLRADLAPLEPVASVLGQEAVLDRELAELGLGALAASSRAPAAVWNSWRCVSGIASTSVAAASASAKLRRRFWSSAMSVSAAAWRREPGWRRP